MLRCSQDLNQLNIEEQKWKRTLGSFQQEFEYLLYFILKIQRMQCETLFNI